MVRRAAHRDQARRGAASKELEDRLKADLCDRGGFDRIHALPHSGADMPDDLDTRLVVLPPRLPLSPGAG